MASSLHLIAPNFLTGSVASAASKRRPFSTTSFSKKLLLNTSKVDQRSRKVFNGFAITSHQCNTSTPVVSDQSWPSNPNNLEPIDSSMMGSLVGISLFNLEAPGLKKMESEENLCVFVNMPGLKREDVKVRIENTTNLLSIEGKAQEIRHYGYMKLPENVDKSSSDMKGEMKDGMFKLTFPKVKDKYKYKDKDKDKELKTSIIANIATCLRDKLIFSFPIPDIVLSVVLMVIKKCCQEIEGFSFTAYKKETANSLQIKCTPGRHKMELAQECACVTLKMPELKIEDVKTYFKRDTLVIEGKRGTKTNKVLYVTGIHLPKNILKKRNMIKTEMQDGVYKATLPYATIEIKIN